MKSYKEDYIPKKDLIDGAIYEGHCRNANFATWDATNNCFVYQRTKFVLTFPEQINHPEDDDGFDLFYPTRLRAQDASIN